MDSIRNFVNRQIYGDLRPPTSPPTEEAPPVSVQSAIPVDAQSGQISSKELSSLLENLWTRFPELRNPGEVAVQLIGPGQLLLATRQIQLTVSGLDRLGEKLDQITAKKQKVEEEREKSIERLTITDSWTRRLSLLSCAMNVAGAAATGGIAGVVMAAAALFTAAGQMTATNELPGDKSPIDPYASSLFVLSGSLAALLLAGGAGFTEALETAGKYGYVAQAGHSLSLYQQGRLNYEKATLDFELDGVQLELTLRRQEEEDTTGRLEVSFESIEKQAAAIAATAHALGQINEQIVHKVR